MKFKILASLVLLFVGAMAQTTKPTLKDDLFENKSELLTKYFPAQDGGFKFAAYHMSPNLFLLKLNQFKKAAFQKVPAKEPSILKRLIIGDINAYSLVLLGDYKNNYGLDSAKQAYFFELIGQQENSVSEKKMNQAREAMFTKKLTAADRKKLDAAIANQSIDLNNDKLFKRSLFYRKLINNKVQIVLDKNFTNGQSNGVDEEAIKMKAVKKLITNQFIRDFYAYDVVINLLNNSKDTVIVKKVYNDLLPQVKEPYYLSDMSKIYNNFITYTDGKPAPDFSYQDVNGKSVSLKDLRGKFVYIDVWATWCVPCKAEIPFLTKIEENYKDKNIYFVSISVDRTIDHDKWKSYVVDNKLKGIQLITNKDFKSGFIENFNINFIPRFILIDPEGKIKDSNAKSPSDPALEKQLNQLLNL